VETKMISCRIDIDKIERLMSLYPGAGMTSVIDAIIDFRLSNGKQAVSLSYDKKLSAEEMEGIKRLKNEAAKKWHDANRERLNVYRREYRKKHPRDPEKVKAERQRYWLKKLRAGGGTDEK
jgi:hypothetical protein